MSNIKKNTKQLGFQRTFKTTELQDIVSTTPDDYIKVSFDIFFLNISILFADASTQIMFNDSIKNSFTLSFDSWTSIRKTVDTQLENQVDIGSAQNNHSPKNLKRAHQTGARIGVPDKAKNIAIYDSLDGRKYHVDIDGGRYPRDAVNIDYASNDYVDQYRDLKIFYKEYVGKELLSPF